MIICGYQDEQNRPCTLQGSHEGEHDGSPDEPKVTRLCVWLDIEGEPEDAYHVVDSLLDAGFFQDAINEHDCDCGPTHVTMAVVRREGEPVEQEPTR